jgi:signal transduction histidine kinase/DNA-binding NarL/FixJ family response regulator
MAEDDDLIALIEDHPEPAQNLGRPWTIAVIDDDPAVHDGTRFALYDYTLNGQGLEIIGARSAAEGRELMRSNPEIAVVLLDVVMETDSAGLDLVDYIRKELRNETVRIILRTGQPGQAPERRVIVDYDINDYKAKTELTADKLFTSLTSALRSYQQIQRMAATRRGLEIIIDAASKLFDTRSIQLLAEGVLTQIASLLNSDCAGILVLRESGRPGTEFSVLAASGCYRRYHGLDAPEGLDPELQLIIHGAFQRRHHEFQPARSVLYMQTGSGREVVVLLEASNLLSETDRALVEVFCSRFAIAFDNAILYEQLQDANSRLEQRVVQRTRELTSANRRLAAQTAQLRRANAFKSEILGTVAHDLKNPLGVILGRTEMLTELMAIAASGEAMRKQVDHIRETADYLTTMIDTLISDAMTDALDISLRRELIDLPTLVKEVVDANRPLAERKQQVIAVAAPASHAVSCDPDRVREAIDNLLSNAIKYTPACGLIELSVAALGAETVIRVTDNGPGLSPEDLSRLFGRFQRLSAKPTGGESSTGLGLSIAKRIVDLHGGHITAESDGPGRGTTFVMTLPMAPVAA